MRKFVLLGILAIVVIYAWKITRPTSIPLLVGEARALDRSGDRVALQTNGAPITLLHFWGTWCGPCREELPSFVEFARKQQTRGARLVAVARDPGYQEVDDFFQKSGLHFETLVDPSGATLDKWGVDAIPTTIVLDRNGDELARYVGSREWNSLDQQREIARVTNGAL